MPSKGKIPRITTPPAFVGHDQESFEAPGIEGVVERLDDEADVDVGREDLRGGFASGEFSGEVGAARQDGLDHRPAVRGFTRQGHPVADFGKAIHRSALQQATCDAGPGFSLPGHDDIGVLVFECDAARFELLGQKRRESIVPGRIPTEIAEVDHARCASGDLTGAARSEKRKSPSREARSEAATRLRDPGPKLVASLASLVICTHVIHRKRV